MRVDVEYKVTIKANAPKQFKQQVGKLLNELMRDYEISGSLDSEQSFKRIFKSNLYYLIDNFFEVKK